MSTPLQRALTLINDMLSTFRDDDKTTIITDERQEMWVAERDELTETTRDDLSLKEAIDGLSQRCGFPIVEDRVQVLGTIGNLVERLQADKAKLSRYYHEIVEELGDDLALQRIRELRERMDEIAMERDKALADRMTYRAERDLAELELRQAGWTHEPGAERWKPPINHEMGRLWLRLFNLEREYNRVTHSRDLACRLKLKAQAELEALKKERSCVGRVRRWLSKL